MPRCGGWRLVNARWLALVGEEAIYGLLIGAATRVLFLSLIDYTSYL